MKTDKVTCGFTRPQSGEHIHEGEWSFLRTELSSFCFSTQVLHVKGDAESWGSSV